MGTIDLSKIIAISGKPGLYKLLSQTRNGFVITSLTDKKCLHLPINYKVSALKDVAVYTYKEEAPLVEIFQKIAQKEKEGLCVDPREKAEKLRERFEKILPDYDKSRVYDSDLKKLFLWYNILRQEGFIMSSSTEERKKKDPTG